MTNGFIEAAYLSKSVHTNVPAGTTTYVVSFAGGMQPTDNIEVRVNGIEAASATVTWLSDSTLQLNGYTPVEGDDIEFRRVSPKDDNLVDLEAGKTIRAVSLMKNFRHVLQVAQEAWDKSDADSAAAEAAAYAAEAAISADIIEPTKFAYNVDSVEALLLTPATEYTTVYLRGRTSVGDGGQGTFVWSTADLSAKVAADPLHGIYVAPTSDTTGASGAWVRQYSGAVNVAWFGAAGKNVDYSTEVQAAFSAGNKITFPDGAYIFTIPVSKAGDNIEVDFGTARIINNGPGHIFVFGTTSDTPVHNGLVISGGYFQQSNPLTILNRNYIIVKGTSNVSIKIPGMKNVSNGGILIEGGCENGTIDVNIDGRTAYSTCRGVWLNGATVSDYAGQLVDTSSITRNATPFPQYAVKNFSVTGKIKIPNYGVYAMNTRNCSVIGADIDASGEGSTRCIAVNNYSPNFRVIGCTLRSDRSCTGVFVTQVSTGVIIANNVFLGTFGGNRDIYVQYLAEATIKNNEFLTDTSQHVEIDMGGSADISDNYVNPAGGYLASGRFVLIRTIREASGTIGDTAGVLPGSIIKNNVIKRARLNLVSTPASTAGNVAGIASVIVKDNIFKDWDLSLKGGDDYPLFLDTSVNSLTQYTYYNNDMFPASYAYRNRADSIGPATQIRSDSQLAVFHVAVISGVVSSTKLYGANFSCGGVKSVNDIILSPRTIMGAPSASVGNIVAVVDRSGNAASYKIVRSGFNYALKLFDSTGAQIPVSTVNVAVDVAVSASAS